jgi:transcription elongation factor Elf1
MGGGEGMEKVKYCYCCGKETVYTDTRKDGVKVDVHCSVCGTYEWFNDGELKERKIYGDREYLKRLMERNGYFPSI